jgi:drug/metabolite transporter (DMT)-like permease
MQIGNAAPDGSVNDGGPASNAGAGPNPNAGIPWMLFALFCFVSMDAAVKTLVQDHSVVQVAWARYFFHLTVLAVILAPRLRSVIKTQHLGLQLARSLLLLATTGFFYIGLRYVALVEASAMMLLAPLIVTALAVPVLKERVGPRRWISVIIGLGGGLIIIRPGADVMQLTILYPLAATCCYAVYQISTRMLSAADPVMTTLFYSALIGAIVTSITVPFHWTAPTPTGWVLLMITGLCGGIGHGAMIKAFSATPASVLAPFSYTNMIWATAYGYFIYAELPDLWTVTGAAIIISSGLYVYHRENAVRVKAPN